VFIEGGNGLRRALFHDLEVLFVQSSDRFTFVVGDDHVQENDTGFDFYGGADALGIRSGSLGMERSNGKGCS
jgi:hypothetical protein